MLVVSCKVMTENQIHFGFAVIRAHLLLTSVIHVKGEKGGALHDRKKMEEEGKKRMALSCSALSISFHYFFPTNLSLFYSISLSSQTPMWRKGKEAQRTQPTGLSIRRLSPVSYVIL